MQLKTPVQQLFLQLLDVLEHLSDHQYSTPVDLLSGATIGQHIRHIVEFFQELDKGYESGTVNYDRRSRSAVLETSRSLAICQLSQMLHSMDRPDKDLALLTYLPARDAEPVFIRTNYSRELLYNMEHIVHHMALLRIGLTALTTIPLPPQFGVAASTLQYRQACAR